MVSLLPYFGQSLSTFNLYPSVSRLLFLSHFHTVFSHFDKISFIQSSCIAPLMTSQGRPLPKFGEWDVNNPASADGFTVIFAKARDEKKTNGTAATSGGGAPGQKRDGNTPYKPPEPYQYPPTEKKWFCCF